MVEQGKDLIVGVGFRMADAMQTAAANYPNIDFAIVDSGPAENLTGILFRVNQASYLVGLIAGHMTETNQIGFINGMDSPIMNEFGVGFYAGVLTANPDATLVGQYSNNFNDPALGRAIASNMFAGGADIIFHAAGDTGNGAIEEAIERNQWVIGVDMDQNFLGPDNVISSAMKRVDVGTFSVIESRLNGTYESNVVVMHDLTTGGVGIAPSSDIHVPADILAIVAQAEADIIAGTVIVPNTEEEFNQMFPGVSFMDR